MKKVSSTYQIICPAAARMRPTLKLADSDLDNLLRGEDLVAEAPTMRAEELAEALAQLMVGT